VIQTAATMTAAINAMNLNGERIRCFFIIDSLPFRKHLFVYRVAEHLFFVKGNVKQLFAMSVLPDTPVGFFYHFHDIQSHRITG
jgi:hypothetical protein